MVCAVTDEAKHNSKDRPMSLVSLPASDNSVYMADFGAVKSLTAVDALVIAEVDLPPGGLRGLERAKRGVASNGDKLPHRYIITSPNMTWIPDISKALLDVRLHDDGKFGYHDFTLWPQFYYPETRHYAFIRCRPSESDLASHPFAILWHSLDQQHDLITERGSLVPKFGRISTSLLERIMEARRHLITDIEQFVASLTPSTRQFEKFIFENGVRAMQLTSVCLGIGAQLFPAVLATFTLFQRQALEMLALLEMLTLWDNTAKMAHDHIFSALVDRSVMGTITHSLHIAIEMASLGVPVWLVRTPHLVPRDIKIYGDAWPQGLEGQASLKAIQGMKSLHHLSESSVTKNRTCLALPLGQLHFGGRPGIDDLDYNGVSAGKNLFL